MVSEILWWSHRADDGVSRKIFFLEVREKELMRSYREGCDDAVRERAYTVRKGAADVRDISWCQRYCGGHREDVDDVRRNICFGGQSERTEWCHTERDVLMLSEKEI